MFHSYLVVSELFEVFFNQYPLLFVHLPAVVQEVGAHANFVHRRLERGGKSDLLERQRNVRLFISFQLGPL